MLLSAGICLELVCLRSVIDQRARLCPSAALHYQNDAPRVPSATVAPLRKRDRVKGAIHERDSNYPYILACFTCLLSCPDQCDLVQHCNRSRLFNYPSPLHIPPPFLHTISSTVTEQPPCLLLPRCPAALPLHAVHIPTISNWPT